METKRPYLKVTAANDPKHGVGISYQSGKTNYELLFVKKPKCPI
ncbi:hypothetical protein [Seonamhaeicola marinus]|nr:hypothetical protein [Seonamhaeicola marinus]